MSRPNLRLTTPVLRVLRVLLDSRGAPQSGADISKATMLGPGTLYPLLARFEASGVATSEWETIDPREQKRPRRRLYTLTSTGKRFAVNSLAEIQSIVLIPARG